MYITPVVGAGTRTDPFRAGLPARLGHSCFIPANADGTPRFSFALCVVRNADWTAFDADASLVNLFGLDLPDTHETVALLVTFLKSKTLRDIPVLRRNVILSALSTLGISTVGLGTSSTFWDVFQRAASHLLGFNPPEDGFLV